MGVVLARGAVFAFGAVLLFGGLAAVLLAGAAGAVPGLVAVAGGGVLVIAAVIERLRYRSETAEQTAAAAGPGGGEVLEEPMEPRFRRTDEVFEDPTSRRRMRVWLDPSSGERRYRAEDRP